MRTLQSKIISLARLRVVAAALRKKGKKIITTNGVFDILHPGHITYLEQARRMGEVLIVGINSDASVKRIKGTKRPLNDQFARARCLAALESVDYVAVFHEDTPLSFVKAAKPHIHVKGGDYRGKEGKVIEKGVVERNGGRLCFKPTVKGYSTTSLIKKIMRVYG